MVKNIREVGLICLFSELANEPTGFSHFKSFIF